MDKPIWGEGLIMKKCGIKLMWPATYIYIVAVGVSLAFLPEEVPMHFDFAGNITRYGSKYEMLIFPLVAVLMNAIFYFSILSMRKKAEKSTDEKEIKSLRQNEKILCYMGVLPVFIFGAINISMFITAINNTNEEISAVLSGNNIAFCVNIVLAIVLILTGNIMPKFKQNAIMGARTKWTLKSEVVWAKTNRALGRMFVVMGFIVAIINAFSVEIAGISMIAMLLLSTVFVISYSKKVYKQLKK